MPGPLRLSGTRHPACPPARLLLQGPSWVLLSAEHLRLLAHIISSQPPAPTRKLKQVLRRLHDLATYQDLQTKPIDWSFRTGPQRHNEPTSR